MTRYLRLDFEGYLVMIKIMIKNFIEKELKKSLWMVVNCIIKRMRISITSYNCLTETYFLYDHGTHKTFQVYRKNIRY